MGRAASNLFAILCADGGIALMLSPPLPLSGVVAAGHNKRLQKFAFTLLFGFVCVQSWLPLPFYACGLLWHHDARFWGWPGRF